MERINFRNACHFFTACHPQRAADSYVIDFSSDSFVNYVPDFRHACALVGPRISRCDWSMDLDGNQLALVELIDGHRSIGEITALVEQRASLPNTASAIETSRSAFRTLWQLDFISMGIRT
jgi:hypothetical protein